MKQNILITSAGQRVALVRGFQETLRRFFPEGMVYTTDMNPKLAPVALRCPVAHLMSTSMRC